MVSSDLCVASATPVIRWHGWRPLPLDMTESEQGGQVFLVLGREGDLALLPTATITYLCYAPLGRGRSLARPRHRAAPGFRQRCGCARRGDADRE